MLWDVRAILVHSVPPEVRAGFHNGGLKTANEGVLLVHSDSFMRLVY